MRKEGELMLKSLSLGLLVSLLVSLLIQDHLLMLKVAVIIGALLWAISAFISTFLLDSSRMHERTLFYDKQHKKQQIWAVHLFLVGLPNMLLSLFLYVEM